MQHNLYMNLDTNAFVFVSARKFLLIHKTIVTSFSYKEDNQKHEHGTL